MSIKGRNIFMHRIISLVDKALIWLYLKIISHTTHLQVNSPWGVAFSEGEITSGIYQSKNNFGFDMSLREVRVSGDDPLRFFLSSLYTTLIPDLPSQGQIHTDWMSWLLASSMTILSPSLKLLMIFPPDIGLTWEFKELGLFKLWVKNKTEMY